jgi:hypothetical protein
MNEQERKDRKEEIMVELSANELTMQEIAEEFGVSRQCIHDINTGMYGNIPGYNYPVRRVSAKPKEKPTDMEVWFEDCYEVKL